MKKMKWLCALLLTAMLVVMLAPAAFAAQPSEKVTVYFTKSDIYGINGSFSFSNPELFTSVSYSTSGMAGSAANNKVYMYSADKSNVTIGVTVTIRGTAVEGDSCTITFDYETSDINGEMTPGKESKTVTVSIPKTPSNSGGSGGSGSSSSGSGSGSGSTTTEQKPVATKADTTELERQIKIAEGLVKEEYTGESWKAVNDALYNARVLLGSTNQKNVDAAAAALAEAIKGLVKMDYTKLQSAIEAAKPLTANDEIGKKFAEFIDALNDSINKLTSTDQAEVDAAAEKLDELTKDLQAMLDELRSAEVVEVEKPVEVEVEPKDPYCNISVHKVWPVLFFISLAINVALAVLIVLFIVRKKRAQKDTTPLVDYDIGDDEP